MPQILDHARASANRLIAVTAIRGRIALGVQTPEDFGLLARLAERDDYSVGGFIDQAMLDGWAGDERLRAYALNVTPGERGRRARHLRPDFGLLINGFPGDREVARLVAADFTNQHPHCLFERDDLRALARHFKSDFTIVPALEAWVLKHRSDDGYTLSHVARVAPTPTLKAALLRCVENDRLSFWAAPALVDLWGAADAEVRAALLATAGGRLKSANMSLTRFRMWWPTKSSVDAFYWRYSLATTASESILPFRVFAISVSMRPTAMRPTAC